MEGLSRLLLSSLEPVESPPPTRLWGLARSCISIDLTMARTEGKGVRWGVVSERTALPQRWSLSRLVWVSHWAQAAHAQGWMVINVLIFRGSLLTWACVQRRYGLSVDLLASLWSDSVRAYAVQHKPKACQRPPPPLPPFYNVFQKHDGTIRHIRHGWWRENAC